MLPPSMGDGEWRRRGLHWDASWKGIGFCEMLKREEVQKDVAELIGAMLWRIGVLEARLLNAAGPFGLPLSFFEGA